MFLITKEKGGYQAIRIRPEDKWDFRKVLPGRTEVRIVLRVRGRQFLLYHTRDLSHKYPMLKRPHLMMLCDEIIAALSEHISGGQEYIQFERVCAAAELQHRKRWIAQGLIQMDDLEEYYGHPIDPKTEVLITRVRVETPDVICMDHGPPVNDTEQEELPY